MLTDSGIMKLEAAIADGSSGEYGAVACVRNVKNPIKAARAVMNHGTYSFLVGLAADQLAQVSGLEMVTNDYFTTESRRVHWEQRGHTKLISAGELGTVGAVALDIHGHLAAAGSTGGLTGKVTGRVGDTAIMGAGIYVDQDVAVAW